MTDTSDSPFAAVASLAEALAENERLRDRVLSLECSNDALEREQFLGELRARIKTQDDAASITAKQYERQISRQQVRIAELEAEAGRLRDRILDLEAKLAILCGSLAKRAVMPEDEQPTIIDYDVRPNAPR